MGSDSQRYVLHQDKQGLIWDLLLYVPTVAILVAIGFKLWYSANQNWTYLLLFLATFFFISGLSRILKTRLMALPSAPVALDVSKQRVHLDLRNGASVELVKDLRYFPDYAGKSMAITGVDLNGKKQQYIFHRGQFSSESEFKELQGQLSIYR